VRPTLLYISSEAVIPAKARLGRNPVEIIGFPRVKHGASLVKPGMTFKVKGLLTQYTSILEGLPSASSHFTELWGFHPGGGEKLFPPLLRKIFHFKMGHSLRKVA